VSGDDRRRDREDGLLSGLRRLPERFVWKEGDVVVMEPDQSMNVDPRPDSETAAENWRDARCNDGGRR
jgi:hypothetical protein